jgi:anti-sigma regulatory factor (Ser/Thr protein kinase)
MKKIDNHAFVKLSLKRQRKRVKRIRLQKKDSNNQRSSVKNGIKIVIPQHLDLDTNRNKLILLLNKIRSVISSGKRFTIDHRMMEAISKEALLMLTSEIERCTKLKNLRLRARKKYFPKNNDIRCLLNKIGYWEYFSLKKAGLSLGNNTKELYLKIIGDTLVSAEKIGSLMQFFQQHIAFDPQTKDKFSDAMLEAAANTVEHAYSTEQDVETISKWWLTATLNTSTDEISFIFYDQGLGIIKTLESGRKNYKLRRLAIGWLAAGESKGGILKKLITTNLSSYKDSRRGNGLISFKTFIDNVQEGELTIYTDDVSYSAISDNIKTYDKSIKGTLISWQIKANRKNNEYIYI